MQSGNHVWNQVKIDGKWYDIDLTWDACVYKETNSDLLHYFSNNKEMFHLHLLNEQKIEYIEEFRLFLALRATIGLTNLKTRKLIRNDNSEYYLTLLPMGFKYKFYLFHENNINFVLVSEDDFEIILSQGNQMVISCYINSFFAYDRIKKYMTNNYAYLGRGVFEGNCFYKERCDEKIITDILQCDVKEDRIQISINVCEKNYKFMLEFYDSEYVIGEITEC